MKVGDLIYYKRPSFNNRYIGIIINKRTSISGGIYEISIRKSNGTFVITSTLGRYLTKVKTNESR
jgi:hypothetical protein